MGAALGLEALLSAGWRGLTVMPVLLLVLALVWMLLWMPRVVLHEESVEVRNVLLTHDVPFAVIEQVRLGAMLRLEVAGPEGPRTLTAWNAPALGRDNPLRRQSELHEQDLRGRRLTGTERLVHDQQRSRSAVIQESWEAWQDHRARQDRRERNGTVEAAEPAVTVGAAPDSDARGPAAADSATRMSTRVNVLPIAVVAVCVLLVVARSLL
jgi:hypothetical protein